MNIIAILDESGSMGPLQKDTIGGFNRFLEEQKALAAEEPAILHVASFNSGGVRRILWGRDVREVYPLTTKDYQPNGGTPLLDAVGEVLSNVIGGPGLVVINTDGEENASKKYTKAQIKALLETLQGQGWTVLFFGANIDSFAEAGSIGVRAHTTMDYMPTGQSLGSTYSATSAVASHLRRGGSGQSVTLNTDAAGNVTADTGKTPTPTSK